MDEIQKLIESLLERQQFLEYELNPVAASLGRVVAEDVVSQLDLPYFNESLRDGFALHKDFVSSLDGSGCFSIKGEIAAGEKGDVPLTHRQVYGIMTGATVPASCVRVIPKELGKVSNGIVTFTSEALKSRQDFIKRKGSEMKRGDLVIPSGAVLSPAHLARLGEVGLEEIVVYRRPKICFFCTGKELVSSVADLKAGKKISSNRHLLSALIQKFGGECDDLGIVSDDYLSLKDLLRSIDLSAYDMVISTGGTGPGKYDLVERVFREVGGDVFCTSLNMRPGKSVVMGKIQNVLFCGLPGPPNAVEALFYEIVGPMLLKLQGVRGGWPETIQAYLEHDINVKSWDVVHLKGGVFLMRGGKCWVRIAEPGEFSTCNVVLEPIKAVKKAGELVDIHLKSSPFGI